MNLLFFGTYDTKNTPRIQVMIDGLREHRVKVVECNVPLPINTANRVAILRQPWRLPLLAFRIAQCWLRLTLKARKLPRSDAVIIGHLGQFDILLARLLFRHTPLALDYMVSGSEAAHDRRLSKGWKNKLLTWLDNTALRSADIIIVDSEEHRQMLPARFTENGIVMLVGATRAWFETAKKPTKRLSKKPLQVVFFGAYTPLQGTPTIGKALSEIDISSDVTMIGTGQDKVETKNIATTKNKKIRITWLDWVESHELSKIVASHDVCLGIFGIGPKTGRVVPNKVYQGAAMGCAIITADTPPQRRVLGDAAILVPPGDHVALAKALNKLANDPIELMKLRQAAYKLAQQHFTPVKVVEPLLERLNAPK